MASRPRARWRRTLPLLTFALMVGACGGSSSTPAPTVPATAAATSIDTAPNLAGPSSGPSLTYVAFGDS